MVFSLNLTELFLFSAAKGMVHFSSDNATNSVFFRYWFCFNLFQALIISMLQNTSPSPKNKKAHRNEPVSCCVIYILLFRFLYSIVIRFYLTIVKEGLGVMSFISCVWFLRSHGIEILFERTLCTAHSFCTMFYYFFVRFFLINISQSIKVTKVL